MNLTERVEKNRGDAISESSRAALKETERAEAVRRAEELEGVLADKSKELDVEKGKVASLGEKLLTAERALGDEVKVVSSLRLDMERLQKELDGEKEKAKGAQEALERAEKDVAAAYKDVVEKYQKSEEFEELVNVKAGYLHEEGFNDCIAFVGAGNMVDPAIHNVQAFRIAALANLEGQEGGGL